MIFDKDYETACRRLQMEREWVLIDNLPPHVVDIRKHVMSVEIFVDGREVYKCDGKPFIEMKPPVTQEYRTPEGQHRIRTTIPWRKVT